jgi:hypothetical protein
MLNRFVEVVGKQFFENVARAVLQLRAERACACDLARGRLKAKH